MDEVNHKNNEVVCQLTYLQVKSVLGWFYAYPFTRSDRSKKVAKFLGECVGDNNILNED